MICKKSWKKSQKMTESVNFYTLHTFEIHLAYILHTFERTIL